MAGEAELFDALDDWEGRAEDILGRERAWEVAEQARAEYASVELVARLMASVGNDLALLVRGAGRVSGSLRRCTETWGLLEGAGQEWVVAHASLLAVTGASERAVPREAWPASARVGLGSAVRRLADERAPVRVVLADGAGLQGTWARVGRDFAELQTSGEQGALARSSLVPFSAIAALCHRPAR